MKPKLLTISFNPQTRCFEDEVFEVFQEEKEIHVFHPKFFNIGETIYMGRLIAYDEKRPMEQKHRLSFKKGRLLSIWTKTVELEKLNGMYKKGLLRFLTQ